MASSQPRLQSPYLSRRPPANGCAGAGRARGSPTVAAGRAGWRGSRRLRSRSGRAPASSCTSTSRRSPAYPTAATGAPSAGAETPAAGIPAPAHRARMWRWTTSLASTTPSRYPRSANQPPDAEGPHRRGRALSVQLWGFTAEMGGGSNPIGPFSCQTLTFARTSPAFPCRGARGRKRWRHRCWRGSGFRPPGPRSRRGA